jgi:AcrR family transcriptional regulator
LEGISKEDFVENTDHYHHGDLAATLIRLGIEALEHEGTEELSLRALAEKAGVSKTAPYRHFEDREAFLGALANEGNHILFVDLERAATSSEPLPAMGMAYMRFAVAHPALYRLMNSSLMVRLPEELLFWAHRSIALLSQVLYQAAKDGSGKPAFNSNAVASVWAYLHGLVLLRIDHSFPVALPEPDWDYLATRIPDTMLHLQSETRQE